MDMLQSGKHGTILINKVLMSTDQQEETLDIKATCGLIKIQMISLEGMSQGQTFTGSTTLGNMNTDITIVFEESTCIH